MFWFGQIPGQIKANFERKSKLVGLSFDYTTMLILKRKVSIHVPILTKFGLKISHVIKQPILKTFGLILAQFTTKLILTR